jgi:hypothetical protein
MRRALATIALLLATSLAPTVTADDKREPSAEDKETARTLFRDGDEKFRAGDYAGALKAFEAAHELVGLPTTGLEVGRTLMMMGRLLEAREMFLKVARLEKKSDEQSAQQAARTEAEGLAEQVARRIPTIRVVVRGPAASAAITLQIDGQEVAGTAIDFPRKVDPGEHDVTVSAPGFASGTRRVSVGEGKEEVLELTLEPENGDAPPEPAPAAPDDDDRGPMPVLSWIGFSLGAVGLAVAIPTGVVAFNEKSDLEGRCDANMVCPQDVESDLDEALTIAHVSTAFFVVAGVGLGVGVVGLIVRDELPDALADMEITVGPLGASVAARF